jgi:hypothetical protein
MQLIHIAALGNHQDIILALVDQYKVDPSSKSEVRVMQRDI